MYSLKKIGKKRYREMAGGNYEDFRVGDTYEHRPGRTISETDNTWFTLLTMNQHPLHFDHIYSKSTEFDKPLVNSTLTLAIITGMSVSSTSQSAIANLGWRDIDLLAPVFIGDTLYAETKIISKRKSKSRSDQGIITVQTIGKNGNGIMVLKMKRSFLVFKQAFSPNETLGY